MKIIDAHYTLGGRASPSLLALKAGGFRPLLRALGPLLHCQVQLHQVGERDVARMAEASVAAEELSAALLRNHSSLASLCHLHK